MTVGLKSYYDVYSNSGDDTISVDPINLLQAGGFNDGSNTLYMQLWEGGTGGLLVKCFRVPAGSSFSWEPSEGRRLTALQWAQSSTPSTYTGTSDNVYIYAEYTTQAP